MINDENNTKVFVGLSDRIDQSYGCVHPVMSDSDGMYICTNFVDVAEYIYHNL